MTRLKKLIYHTEPEKRIFYIQFSASDDSYSGTGSSEESGKDWSDLEEEARRDDQRRLREEREDDSPKKKRKIAPPPQKSKSSSKKKKRR